MANGDRSAAVDFVHQQVAKALQDQMNWIDVLDSKGGILLAANGVIASVILGTQSALRSFPRAGAVTIITLVVGSLLLALLAFATRHYQVAPDVETLLSPMMHADKTSLQLAVIPAILQALDVNEPKVSRKAGFLSLSGFLLMGAVVAYASQFTYVIMDR